MVTQESVYAYATVSVSDGRLDTLIMPHVNRVCMQIFLDEVASRYPEERLLMILDGAGWHRESCLNIPASMRLVSLPPYSPGLNPVEHIHHRMNIRIYIFWPPNITKRYCLVLGKIAIGKIYGLGTKFAPTANTQ